MPWGGRHAGNLNPGLTIWLFLGCGGASCASVRVNVTDALEARCHDATPLGCASTTPRGVWGELTRTPRRRAMASAMARVAPLVEKVEDARGGGMIQDHSQSYTGPHKS